MGYIVVGTGVFDGPLQTVRANKICLLQRRCLITFVGTGVLDGPLQTVRIAENFVKWTVGDAGPYIFVSFVQHTPCRLR